MIDILMALYNGERFLGEQIDSVIAQSFGDWHLYICDDGSADGSVNIAREYGEKYPERISARVNAAPTGSAAGNFIGMLRESRAEYVMFCDQDDVWREDKIRLTLDKMREMEREFPGLPLLVHTDMAVTDRALNVTAPSFMKYQGLSPRYNSLNRLLCQNNITGCTMMMNRALADIVKDAPAEAMLMHDWWAGLAAAAFGAIGFVDEPLNLYRQHGGNRLGAVNNRSVRGAAKMLRERLRTKKRISVTYKQGRSFYDCYKASLDDGARKILETYIDIPGHCKAVRAARLIKYGFLKQNFLAAAGQLIFC